MDDPALVLAAVLLGAAVAADLLFSPAYMRRVRADIAAGDTRARTGMYRLSIALAWTAATVALALLLGGGLDLGAVGLRPPEADNMRRWAAHRGGRGSSPARSSSAAARPCA